MAAIAANYWEDEYRICFPYGSVYDIPLLAGQVMAYISLVSEGLLLEEALP
jgi:hypothetical protein